VKVIDTIQRRKGMYMLKRKVLARSHKMYTSLASLTA